MNPSIEIDAAEKYPENKNKETREKSSTIFNKVRQFAYVLGARGRDFIDSTIKTSKYRGILEGFS